jgi:hypothetical protein
MTSLSEFACRQIKDDTVESSMEMRHPNSLLRTLNKGVEYGY